MAIQDPIHEARTTVWQNRPRATVLVLVRTLKGLPYGTSEIAMIEGLGRAHRTGVTRTGTGDNEAVVEVFYTLD